MKIVQTLAEKRSQIVKWDADRKIKSPDLLLAVFLSVYVHTRIIPMPDMLANLFAALAGGLCFGYCVLMKAKAPRWGCLALGIVFCLSLIASLIHNGNGSVYYVLWVGAFLGVAMLIYSYRINPKFVLAQYYAFALILTLYALFGGPVKDFLSIGSENNISTYLILYLMVYLLSRRYSNAPVALLPVAVAIVLTMWTGCRGGLLALGAMLVPAFVFNVLRSSGKNRYAALWRKFIKSKPMMIGAAVLALGAIALVLTSDFFAMIIWKLTAYGGTSVRTEIWGDYFSSTFDSAGNFFLGPDIHGSTYEWLIKYPGNPHNAFLSLHAHFGLLPFILVLLALVWTAVWIIRQKKYILGTVLVAAVVRSFFDWTAGPGPYDVIYYYFAICLMDRFPACGGVGRKALRYNQKPAEVNLQWNDVRGLAMKLYNYAKKVYSWLATLVYDLGSERKMVDTVTLFDTPTMTRYHHIVSALRYVAVEEYYGLNNFGKALYINANQWESDAALQEDLDKFDALIKSIESRGYDTDSSIYVDLDGNCINGTHRLALCAWFQVRQMPMITIKRHLKPSTIQQMREHYRLSDEDFRRLEDAYGRMRERLQG